MDLIKAATQLGRILQQQNKMCTTAESCTGGGVAEAITAIPGSSKWFERGFVVYSNDAKRELLSVPLETLKAHGAVSEETARAMALGALKHSHGQMSVAITGIAGPDDGTSEKPVGTVWFAWALDKDHVIAECRLFDGDRSNVRQQSVLYALSHWVRLLAPI